MPHLVYKNFFQGWRRVVASAVLVTFTNSLISPVFAFKQEISEESQQILTEITPQHTVLTAYAPSKAEGLNSNVINLAQAESTITPKIGVLIVPIDNQCDPTEKRLGENIPQVENSESWFEQTWNAAIGYIIIDGAAPIIKKELIKKSVNKVMRNVAFVGEFKAAYNLADSGVFLRRSPDELVRNTNRLILAEKAKSNYEEAGTIIRTSLIGHAAMALPQVAIGFLVAPIFVQLGTPPKVGDMVGSYLKWSSFGALTKELTGKTGENLLAIERPEWEFLPALINSGLMAIIYFGPSRALNVGGLSRLAISETLATGTTTVLLLTLLNYDEKYQKYQIFDFSNDTLPVYQDTLSKIQEYSVPAFISNLSPIIAETSNILMDAVLGGEGALKARGIFTLFTLFVSPLSLANAQQSGRLVAKSLATNAPETEIKHQMRQGLLANFLVSTPYFIFIVAPGLIHPGENRAQDGVIRILAVNSIVSAVQSAAKDQLIAFKASEHGWLKTVGDVSAIGVPVIGVILFRTRAIDPNLQNRLIIQIISILPALFTIYEAFQ